MVKQLALPLDDDVFILRITLSFILYSHVNRLDIMIEFDFFFNKICFISFIFVILNKKKSNQILLVVFNN